MCGEINWDILPQCWLPGYDAHFYFNFFNLVCLMVLESSTVVEFRFGDNFCTVLSYIYISKFVF